MVVGGLVGFVFTIPLPPPPWAVFLALAIGGLVACLTAMDEDL